MERLFGIFEQLLLLHIGTKTNDPLFHEKSAAFYQIVFDIFHEVSEKNQDIWEDKPVDCEEARQETYDLLEEAKELLEEMIEEDNSYGKDNLLRWLVDKLEFQCWNAKGFIEEEEKDED